MAIAELKEIKARVRKTPVTLIMPPSPFLADERVFPSLGLLKVAAQLEGNGNHVEVLDLTGYRNYNEIVGQYIDSSPNTHFGISATTPQMPAAFEVMKTIRGNRSNAQIILGGPHATLTYASMKAEEKDGERRRGWDNFDRLTSVADKIVVGDGEKAIFVALDPDNHDQIIEASDRHSELFLQPGELEEYPWPARHLIDLPSYHYTIDGEKATSMIVQLGCPFECGFCSGRTTHFLRMARTRSITNALAEMESLHQKPEYGYTGFMLYDDELNVSKGKLEALCRAAIELQNRLGVDFRLRGFVRADLFTKEQAELMYQAGFRILLSGTESGSDQSLDAMRKKTTPDINSRCREIAGNANLKFKALNSLGHPGESAETIQESIDWVLANKPDDVDWTVITLYPGSPYFDKSRFSKNEKSWFYSVNLTRGSRKGETVRLWSDSIDYTQNADYYKGVPGSYESHVWTDCLTKDDLVNLRDEAERITRSKLGLPPIAVAAAQQFEHSMGMLPPSILRTSQ